MTFKSGLLDRVALRVGIHPEPKMDGTRQARTADGAYRNAADLGVSLMSPDPISMAI
jgi:alpha/beta superfamily hydrolase